MPSKVDDKDSVGMTELLRPSSREAFQLDFWQPSSAGTAELLADRGGLVQGGRAVAERTQSCLDR